MIEMVHNQLFTLALGLVRSWMVDDEIFRVEEKRLEYAAESLYWTLRSERLA